MNEFVTYNDDILEKVNLISSNSFEKFSGFVDDEHFPITFHTTTSKLNELKRVIDNFSDLQNRRHGFYLKAINNLIKKNNFLELSVELLEDQIDEVKYSEEIECNQSKYVINIEHINSISDIEIISEIVREINIDFSIDEVAEIFSVDAHDLENQVKNL